MFLLIKMAHCITRGRALTVYKQAGEVINRYKKKSLLSFYSYSTGSSKILGSLLPFADKKKRSLRC